MSKQFFSWEKFYQVPIIGIVRGLSPDQLKSILPVYASSGLSSIEITMNTKSAAEMISFARKKYPSLNVGAGTVCTEKELTLALDAGAQFIVTPIIDRKVIKLCVKNKTPIFPGALTPTEIYQAWSLGASMVKVYPAKALGPGYIKDIKAPLDKIKLVPTGGVGLEDIAAFKKAGADGFGIGSPLFVKQMIEAKNWDLLGEHFKRFVKEVS